MQHIAKIDGSEMADGEFLGCKQQGFRHSNASTPEFGSDQREERMDQPSVNREFVKEGIMHVTRSARESRYYAVHNRDFARPFSGG